MSFNKSSFTKNTKIDFLHFLVFLSSLIFLFFICLRYLSFGSAIELNFIISFASIYIVSILLLFTSFYLYKSYLNPLSLFCLFLLFYSYSFLPLTKNYMHISNNTHIVIFLTSLSFIAGLLLPFTKMKIFSRRLKLPLFNNLESFIQKKGNQKIILLTLFGISIFIFILETSKIGYIPVFEMFNRFVYQELNNVLIPLFHYFVMLLAIIPAWAFIFFKEEKLKKWEYYIIHAISIFIIFNYFSRQFLLMYMISYFITYNFYHKMTIKAGIITIFFMLFMFFFIGYLRVIQDKSFNPNYKGDLQNEYLMSAARAKYKLTTLECYATLYSSARFYALENLVHQKDSSNYYGYGMYTFKPIVSVLFLNRLGLVDYETKYNIPKEIPTFVIDPYLDYGYLGSVIINFIYGLFSSLAFFAYLKKKKSSIINLSVVLFCIIMMSFLSFFNTFFVLLVLGINMLLIKNEEPVDI